MNGNRLVGVVFIISIAYIVGLANGRSAAEKESRTYFSTLETMFLKNENVPPVCSEKWQQAITDVAAIAEMNARWEPQRDPP